MRGCAAVQALRSRHPELQQVHDRLPWAVAMSHSRTFVSVTAGRLMHILVPGIDMVNHSPEPNAAVKWVHKSMAHFTRCCSRFV